MLAIRRKVNASCGKNITPVFGTIASQPYSGHKPYFSNHPHEKRVAARPGANLDVIQWIGWGQYSVPVICHVKGLTPCPIPSEKPPNCGPRLSPSWRSCCHPVPDEATLTWWGGGFQQDPWWKSKKTATSKPVSWAGAGPANVHSWNQHVDEAWLGPIGQDAERSN